MDFLSSLRTMFASIDIFISNLISKIYLLILQLADVNLVNKTVSDIIERVYGIIGLFMLFKLVLVIINYIVSPDKVQSVGNIVKRVIIALILIPTVPVIFEKAYQLQGIILKENIIGNIILGGEAGNESEDVEEIGDEVAYLVFSNFLDYNDDGALSLIFSDCPNIFLEEDFDKKTETVNFCPMYMQSPRIPLCGYYLYYPALIKPEYGAPDEDGNYPDSRDKYYSCKSGDDLEITKYSSWTMFCGIRDGMYIFDLINKGREEHSVSTILSSEIITAIESDPVFYEGRNGYSCSDPKQSFDSDGDFVFEYNFILATLIGLIVIFLLIVICVDIAIRAVKLSFLQVISPIPIVSYIDVNDSKLFNGWLKETITTYLQLFIRLAVVFFSILLFKWLLKECASNEIMVNVFIIIGIFLFTLQMPKLLCELFNLNSNNGFFDLIKNVGKFAIGTAAIGVSTIGGAAANIAASSENIKNVKNSLSTAKSNLRDFKTNMGTANGALGKLGVFGSTMKNVGGLPISILKVPGSIVAGGISSGARTTKKLIDNKGSYKSGTIKSSISESSAQREKRRTGISSMSNSDMKLEIKELENRQESLKTSYQQAQENLALNLSSEANAKNIERAFEQNYDSYADYVSDMNIHGASADIISEDKYNEYNEMYKQRDDINDEMEEIKDRLELLNTYFKEK